MGINLKFYDLKLVKEKGMRYDCNRQISCPSDIYNFAKGLGLHELAEEEFHMYPLDTKNNILGVFCVSKGSLNASIVHPREVFKRALLANAKSIVVLHNHPSNNCVESSEDITITKRLKEVGEIIGIPLLDHLIITEDTYLSFKEHDYL